MKTILHTVANRLAAWAGTKRTVDARVERVALWLVVLASCNVGEVQKITPRALAGIIREVRD